MDIKYKLYPYPVLSDFSDDYQNCCFKTCIDMVRDGYNLRLDFVSELTSNSIKELINVGKASYVYHLECAQTGFRHVIITQKTEERFPLDKRMICGRLQVCTFIVAREDLHSYSSDEFHSDYSGMSFEIEAGCIIAVGTQKNYDIYKEIDDLANLSSIFGIKKNPDEKVKEMFVEYESRRILIKLPFNDFFTYKQLKNDPKNIPVLNAMTVIPALVYVLGEIKQRNIEERQELDDRMWYRIIKKVLMGKFGVDVEDISFNDINTIEYAQKLINSPIPEAFSSLFVRDDESEGEN